MVVNGSFRNDNSGSGGSKTGSKSRTRAGGSKTGSKSRTRTGGAVVDTGFTTLVGWWVFEFVCWGFLGLGAVTILWLLHAPWVNVGEFLVGTNSPIPGIGFVAGLGPAGAWLSSAMATPVIWVATVAMAAMNTIQVIALLHEFDYLKLPQKWVGVLSSLAIASWLIELFVALQEHSIYAGGFNGFMTDLPVPTFSYFRMGEVISVVVLMFLFEFSIAVGAVCILSLKKNKARSKAQARAKSTGAA